MDAFAAIGHDVAAWAVNFIANHPEAIGWGLLIFIAATFVCNGIKWAWPVYHEMPRWARFVLGFMMPLALNFWAVTKKVGMQEPAAPSDAVATPTVK